MKLELENQTQLARITNISILDGSSAKGPYKYLAVSLAYASGKTTQYPQKYFGLTNAGKIRPNSDAHRFVSGLLTTMTAAGIDASSGDTDAAVGKVFRFESLPQIDYKTGTQKMGPNGPRTYLMPVECLGTQFPAGAGGSSGQSRL